MGEETRLEDRLAFLRSLTQEDRDFIARFGEEKWKMWKAIQNERNEEEES
jgi:hypothetical protein